MRYSKYHDFPKEYDALVVKMSGRETGEFKKYFEDNKDALASIDITSYNSLRNQIMMRMDRVRVVHSRIRSKDGKIAVPGQFIYVDDFKDYFGVNNTTIYNWVSKGYVSKVKIVDPDALAEGKWGEAWTNQ